MGRVSLPLVLLAIGCGSKSPAQIDASPPPSCDFPLEFAAGDDGVADAPATVAPGRAAAGRLAADDLPADPLGLAVWEAGDFVLANDRVAIVIEEVDKSDLYDPWGGRPVGIALVRDG